MIATLEANIDRLVTNGRIFLLRGADVAAVRESAEDAGVEIEVRWTDHGWWVVLS